MRFIILICMAFSFSAYAKPAFINVKEFQIEYEISGSGEHVVLLEAGGSAGMTDWDPVFSLMAKYARVIRYSRVGNGNSTPISRYFTSRDYADYASEFLEGLKINESVILVGHSYGGSIARDFSAAYPNKLKALLMLDPSSEHDVDIVRSIDLERGNREIAKIKIDDMKNGMSNQYLDFWSKGPLPDYPQIQDIPVTVIASIRTTDNPPNLFFTGQGRRMWGELWKDWANAFPRGKAVLTEKSGHYVQFDEPELVIKELKILIQKLDKH